ERILYFRDEIRRGLGIRNVALRGDDARACGLELSLESVGLGRTLRIIERNVRSAFCEFANDLAADAACSAGNDGGLSFKYFVLHNCLRPCGLKIQSLSLLREKLSDALFSEGKHRVHLIARKRFAFRRALDLDKFPFARAHDIHIDLGGRIFGVSKIEDRRVFADADAYCRDLAKDRIRAYDARLHKTPACESERDVCPRNRRAACAAVRLYDIAIEKDLAFAK